MKNTLLLFILILLSSFSHAQNKQKAEKLVAEGITYNDKGQYQAAISKYDEALKLDKNNLVALAEKALTLYNLKSYDETVRICKKAIQKHPDEPALKAVYVTYGSTLDVLNKVGKSLKIYNEGIKLFPGFYELYFNKGVTLARNKKFSAALECLQNSVTLNPQHASSHNIIARILYLQHKKIPALLTLCRFLSIEPEGNRGKINLQLLRKIIKGEARKTGKGNIALSLDPKTLESAAKGKKKENDFSKTAVMLNLSSALDYSDAIANETAVERFIRKFKLICTSLEEHQKDNFGFYWTYYVPYFIEMKNKKLILPFAYMIFATAQKQFVNQWTTAHQAEMAKLYAWNKLYQWPQSLH